MLVDDVAEVIRVWLEIWASEPDERLRNEYVALTRTFAELSRDRADWIQVLNGLDTMKSPYLESVCREGEVRSLVRFLQARFPGQVPAELIRAIEQSPEPGQTEQWITLAATASSLDDFRQKSGL